MQLILHATHRTQTGCEVGDEVVREVGSAQEETLNLVIETQLPDGHQNLS